MVKDGFRRIVQVAYFILMAHNFIASSSNESGSMEEVCVCITFRKTRDSEFCYPKFFFGKQEIIVFLEQFLFYALKERVVRVICGCLNTSDVGKGDPHLFQSSL